MEKEEFSPPMTSYMKSLTFFGLAMCIIISGNVAAAQTGPDFSAFPPAEIFPNGSKIVLPDFNGKDRQYRDFRTRIKDGMSKGPNFSGHFNVIEIGCGTNCMFAFVGDLVTGNIVGFPYGGEEYYEMKLQYVLDSTLLQATWSSDDATCSQQDLVFDGVTFQVVEETAFPRVNYCN